MGTVTVVYSDNTPDYPESTNESMAVFEEAFPEYEVDSVELPTYYGHSDVEPPVDSFGNTVAIFAQPGELSRELIESAPELEVIAIMGSGYKRVDVEATTDHGIVVTHNPEIGAPFVAEYTLMAMIYLIRRIETKTRRLSEGAWKEIRTPTKSLMSATVGVVGVGNIGYDVVELLRPFGPKILAYDPYLDGSRESSIYPRHGRSKVEGQGVELTDLETLCERSDVVTVHVPNNDETEGLIGEAELERMGSDAFLINTSRGPVVDERALVDALSSGGISGAAIDVFENEPPATDNYLLESERVLTTPHIAGVGDSPYAAFARSSAEKIRTVLDGDAVNTIVNPEVLESDTLRTRLG